MNQVTTSSGYKLFEQTSNQNYPNLASPFSSSNRLDSSSASPNPPPTFTVYNQHLNKHDYKDTNSDLNQLQSLSTCSLNNDQRNISSMQNNSLNVLVSGSVAGAISRTATAGFERLTIIQQVQGLAKDGPKYTGCIRGLREMIYKEGIWSLFRGNGANIVKVSPNSAIRFFTYEYCKNQFTGFDTTKKLSGVQSMTAGAMAGLTSTFATYPLDVIRTRLSLQGCTTSSDFGAVRYKGIYHGFSKIHAEEGVRGLYKGLGTAIMSVAPWVSLSFASYEGFKSIVHKLIQQQQQQQLLEQQEQEQQQISFGQSSLLSSPSTISNAPNVKGRDMLIDLGCGAASGCITMTVCYPLDVLRRRMMIQGIGGETNATIYKNGLHALRSIVKSEGVSSLYMGIVPAYFKVVPTVAISFAVYELCKGMLGNEQKNLSDTTKQSNKLN